MRGETPGDASVEQKGREPRQEAHRRVRRAGPRQTLGVTREPSASEGGRAALPRLLTAAETATILRTSKKAIWAMVERAQLPGVVRIGRRVLIREDALVEWLSHKSGPSPKE